MPYSSLPDRRINYDNDGSIVAYGSSYGDYNTYQNQWTAIWNQGFNAYLSAGDKAELNDTVYGNLSATISVGNSVRAVWFIFPESRNITALVIMNAEVLGTYSYGSGARGLAQMQGSNDTANGVDGTWEAPSLVGVVDVPAGLDTWRRSISGCTFTGAKKALRFFHQVQNTQGTIAPLIYHIYGEKAAGQTPDDIIFINHDDTPGVEYALPEDFGDQQLGTTVVRQFRIKNVSGTKTANTILLTCSDTDFGISSDGTTWVTTINLASLSAGAESATYYVRCVTPAVGNLLGPRASRITVTVASYT